MDPGLRRVAARATAALTAESDWTCRILAAGLAPGRVHWYRFTDEHGFASRVGRTRAAPAPDDARPARFAVVSRQNVRQGACDDALDVEFVGIPRPVDRAAGGDGGPVRYRVTHRVRRWAAGEHPRPERIAEAGALPLVL